MKLAYTIIFFMVILFGIPTTASALTVRYGLVIGNNVGVDSNGEQPFPPLKHAEREARLLKQQLVRLSNFDSDSARTVMLTGTTSDEVTKAFKSLIAQKKKDEKMLGKVDSLFFFFFTGHGLQGQLLLNDGPLSADKLGELFRSMDADFTVGVFDACFSGSLDKEALASKGIEATPGLNLFRKLPEQVLSAEGSIWYVSSGPSQASYEDKTLGGVFTHFFIEGLKYAPLEGPGITLEQIWNYARRHTVEYTAARNRQQVPEQFISKFRSSGPIYFSFPIKRDATLFLTKSIEGDFALAYDNGHLTEMIQKSAGSTQEIPIFPGKSRLILLEDKDKLIQKEIEVEPGGEIVIHSLPKEAPTPAIGQQSHSLFEKGIGLKKRLNATQLGPGLTSLLGAEYKFNMVGKEALLARNMFSLALRLDYGGFSGGLSLGYGFDRRDFTDWSYKIDAALGELHMGFGFDPGPLRITVGAGFDTSHIWQEYQDGHRRTGWQHRPFVNLGLLFPRRRTLVWELFFRAGPTYSPGVGVESESIWHFSGGAGLALYYRVK